MQVNVGYAYGQLVRAREKGDARGVAKWQAVIDGMRSGNIEVGSRTPTKAPAWVTLEVVTGGFATGRYAAGGPLQAHETAVATSRAGANLHYLESAWRSSAALLASGHYRIDYPEEGALLVHAWLRGRGEHERATALVETIAPWFEALRFFPAPATRATPSAETVRLQDVETTIEQLRASAAQERLDIQRDAELVWKPLRDRAIALWIETLEGELPRIVDGAITGGVPGRVFPDGWRAWVHALVADCRAVTAPKTARASRVIELVESLARIATHPNALDARALGHVRRAIAEFVTAHGAPGSAALRARRETDARAVSSPRHVDLRDILVDRLRGDDGVELARISAPVSIAEATHRVPAGTALPGHLVQKAARSWDAPIETLAERGLVPSAEVFARVLPQLTAHVRAQGLPDEPARRLYTAMYRAFRRRRGLLLVDYASQVRFHELPWVAEMENGRSKADGAAQAARASRMLARASGAALRTFPQTITPNKLVTELSAFAAAAKVELPLVEELAADIFMGSFTAKFAQAAKVSARVIEGTLYQRYYAVDTFALARLGTAKLADDFAALCHRRAGHGKAWGVAQNGKTLEQCQILTTHNLAVLFDRLALGDALAPHLPAIAMRCFVFVVRQLRLPGSYREQLTRIKNAAYAWRQMVFYLSFIEDPAGFAALARTRIAKLDEAFRTRLEPLLRGLELAIAGTWSTWAGFPAGGGRVFTGWSTERHWLMP